MKRTIRLTEGELRGMIQEAVANTLNERYSTTSDGLPTTDDFCWLIFERTFRAVGEINELLREIEQQMPQSMKKRFFLKKMLNYMFYKQSNPFIK